MSNSRVAIYGQLAQKVRRALRNKTGCTFSYNEVVALAQAGLLLDLARREVDELLALPAVTDDSDATSES